MIAVNDRYSRTRLERLLNYKRYIDWLIDRELERVNKQRKERPT